MKVDKTLINTLNKANVLNAIRKQEHIFRAEIARITDLSIPTVMKITEEFIDKGLVRESGKGQSTGGKPPQLLELIPDAYYIVGVDIGTTYIVTILMDLSASVIQNDRIPTEIKSNPISIVNRVIESIQRTIMNSGVDYNKIMGISLGVPGLLDASKGNVLFSPDFQWENVHILKPIKDKFNIPVIIDNVTRAMAMGEKWFGLAKDINNFICINLGHGIGAAIVVNGEIYGGSSGAAGEFGHITLKKDGPVCDCGNRGCLEALASANAISKKARAMIDKGIHTKILDMVDDNLEKIEAKHVFDAAKQGDALSIGIIEEATQYLGIAIAGLINLLDPELIILEGGVARAGDILIQNVKAVVRERQMKYAGKQTRIVTSELSLVAAIGAATFILKAFIESGGDIDNWSLNI